MSYRAWMLVAAIGLTALPPSGRAQGDEQDAERPAAEQQQPPQVLPIPLPVQIIEGEEASISREAAEAESREREIEDLAAQTGMNNATQAMNEATQRMAGYAWWSTVLIGIGTLLLLWTLHLTRAANRAAREAVAVTRKLGKMQMRAYLSIGKVKFENFVVGSLPSIGFTITNRGQTPARIYDARLRFFFQPREGKIKPPPDDGKWITNNVNISISPGQSFDVEATFGNHLREEVVVQHAKDNRYITVEGFVFYRDAFGAYRRTIYRFQLPDVIPDTGGGLLSLCASGNRQS